MNTYDHVRKKLQTLTGFHANFLTDDGIRLAIRARTEVLKIPGEKYVAALEESPRELARLAEEVVIGETWFFRDEKPFERLVEFARQQVATRSVLRILSAPCSTGEEPYSIAVALLTAGFAPEQFQIQAFDINARFLDFARQRIYRARAFRNEKMLDLRYFKKIGNGDLQVEDKVAGCIEFAEVNLCEHSFASTPSFDVIFCRNLMIYLDDAPRQKLVRHLHGALTETGLLFVGHAEGGVLDSKLFKTSGPSNAFAYSRKSLQMLPPPAVSAPPAQVPASPSVNKNRPGIKPILPRLPQISATDLLAKAASLADSGKLKEGAELCAQYLKGRQSCVDGIHLLASIRIAEGLPAEAEQLFNQVVYLDPRNTEAMVHLEHLCSSRGDKAGATRWRQRINRLATPK